MQKLRLDLLPPHSLAEAARTLTVGAEKHGATNYLDHPREDEETQQMASLLRHLNADRCGHRNDSDGFMHLAAVAARALMIIELRRHASISPAPPCEETPNGSTPATRAHHPASPALVH